MDRWKAEMGRGREKRRVVESRSEKRKSQKKEGADARKGRKVAKHCVFPMRFEAPEGRKVGSLKRRVRSHLARWKMKKCTPLWREAHFEVKMYKTSPGTDHFWKLRCWKRARRCGAKHISKSKCAKHTRFGPLLEVEMLKNCTLFWREAHVQVKMYKTHQLRTTFGSSDVEKVRAVVARSTFRSQKCKKLMGTEHFSTLRCRKSARRCGAKHISKSKWSKHPRFGSLLEVEMSKKCTPLRHEAHFEVKMYTRRRMARERRGAGSSVVSIETLY